MRLGVLKNIVVSEPITTARNQISCGRTIPGSAIWPCDEDSLEYHSHRNVIISIYSNPMFKDLQYTRCKTLAFRRLYTSNYWYICRSKCEKAICQYKRDIKCGISDCIGRYNKPKKKGVIC